MIPNNEIEYCSEKYHVSPSRSDTKLNFDPFILQFRCEIKTYSSVYDTGKREKETWSKNLKILD